MRCILCQKFSIIIICKKCQNSFLEPSFLKRESEGFTVFSFYKMSDIEDLIKTKYFFLGCNVFKILANNSLKIFAKNFEYPNSIDVVPIDDSVEKGYSHSAILAKALKSKILKPKYGAIVAKNRVVYAGKSLDFRQNNPKNFELKKKLSPEVIIVDDVITTGETMKQAKNLLKKDGIKAIFGITLADARL